MTGAPLFVATSEIRPIGSVVRIELSLPDAAAPIGAVGEVRWVRAAGALPTGIGCGIGNILDVTESRICQLHAEAVKRVRASCEGAERGTVANRGGQGG